MQMSQILVRRRNMNSPINCSDKDSRKELVHARSWRASWDSCACWKVGLGRSCAVEAALLAPSKEASGLAVFEAIVGSGGIAVTASIADADFAGHATLELGMVDAKPRAPLPHLLLLSPNVLSS